MTTKSGKQYKILVAGMQGVGKTALLQQLIVGDHVIGMPLGDTLEDTYVALVDAESGRKEKLRLFDTAGVKNSKEVAQFEFKHYANVVDAFVLVFDITNNESFKCVEQLKRLFDKCREKKEVAQYLVIGTKVDLQSEREVDIESKAWAAKEKLLYYEVSLANRESLFEPFQQLVKRLTAPQGRAPIFKRIRGQLHSSDSSEPS